MRRVGTFLGFACLTALLAGCNSTRWNFLKSSEQAPNQAKQGGGKVPPVASLVEYMNDNANRVRTLRVDDLSVTASQGIAMAVTLTGKMVSEKPRGFRMSLDAITGSAVDLGSSNQEFWYWIGKAQPPYQFYCSYGDLEKGIQYLPIPFQPEWIMESLGIGQYGPAERYQLDSDNDNLRLSERSKSPQGAAIRKVIVMRRRETRAPEPQVTHYLLLDDASGKEICSAHIVETMVDRATGAIVPRKLDLYWRQENAKLSMTFNSVTVNTPVPQEAFIRRPLSGVPSFNLARMQIDGAPVQRVQGTNR